MTDRENVIELKPGQLGSVSGGSGTLGVYRPGFRYKQESLRFFKACVGEDVYSRAMNSEAGRAHHYTVARAFLNQTDWEKFVWIEEFGSLDGFPEQKGGGIMEERTQTVFRRKTLDRISSPEQLTDYLCVTNPGIWAILAAVILLLAGLFAWATVGTLETSTSVKVIVEDHMAQVVPTGTETVADGMPLRIASQEFYLASTGTDDYGRTFGVAEVTLPDGVYDGTVVVEQTHPIDFLLESR